MCGSLEVHHAPRPATVLLWERAGDSPSQVEGLPMAGSVGWSRNGAPCGERYQSGADLTHSFLFDVFFSRNNGLQSLCFCEKF